MFIKKIEMDNFGKFHKKEITFTKGLNLIYGENEMGKSTIDAFIKGMLFGIEKQRGRASKDDAYTKYQPWENPTYYKGSMEMELRGTNYRIERNFYKEERTCKIIDTDNGRILVENSKEREEFLEGITESLYDNTVNIEQGSARTTNELTRELQNYITNMGMTGSKKVYVKEAIANLKKKRKELEQELTDSEKSIEEIEDTLERIRIVEDKQNCISKEMQAFNQKKKEYEEEIRKEKEELIPLLEYVKEYPSIEAEYSETKVLMRDWEEKVQEKKLLKKKAEEMDDVRKVISDKIIQSNIAKFGIGIICIIIGTYFSMKYKREMIYGLIFFVLAFFSFLNGIVYRSIKKRKMRQEEYSSLRMKESNIEREQDSIRDKIAIKKERISEYALKMKSTFYVDDRNMRELDITIENLKGKIEEKQRKASIKLEEGKITFEKMKWESAKLGEENIDSESVRNQYENLNKRKAFIVEEINAVSLSEQMIQSISLEIHAEIGNKIDTMLTEVVKEITEGKYTRVFADENLNLKLESNNKYVKMESLSKGTIEQIYFSLRMAASKLLIKEENMPIILDECFAMYDDRRMKAILNKVITNINNQIILFTCTGREKHILDNGNMKYNCLVINN